MGFDWLPLTEFSGCNLNTGMDKFWGIDCQFIDCHFGFIDKPEMLGSLPKRVIVNRLGRSIQKTWKLVCIYTTIKFAYWAE